LGRFLLAPAPDDFIGKEGFKLLQLLQTGLVGGRVVDQLPGFLNLLGIEIRLAGFRRRFKDVPDCIDRRLAPCFQVRRLNGGNRGL
jgi:hypothetical protein